MDNEQPRNGENAALRASPPQVLECHNGHEFPFDAGRIGDPCPTCYPPPPAVAAEDYTRETLIALCEAAVVPVEKWHNRDSAGAQRGVGEAWVLLRAGAEFTVLNRGSLVTDEDTVWIEIVWPGFQAFEFGRAEREHWEDSTFYLPTAARLARSDGRDWY